MNELKIENGKISALIYVRVKRSYTCDCGCKGELTLDIPDVVELLGELHTDVACPECGKAIVIPYGHHYVENFHLLTRPVQR